MHPKRPPLTQAYLNVVMPHGLRRALEDAAARSGRSLAAEVRQAIQAQLGVDINGQPSDTANGATRRTRTSAR